MSEKETPVKVVVKKEYGSVALILTLVFLFLKVGNVIDWPWIWVFSPFWIPVVAIVGLFLLIGTIALISGLVIAIISAIRNGL